MINTYSWLLFYDREILYKSYSAQNETNIYRQLMSNQDKRIHTVMCCKSTGSACFKPASEKNSGQTDTRF